MPSLLRSIIAAACLAASLAVTSVRAHEGHDHDKPPPLALPVAPRIVSVTPDFELVGVSSGEGRLTLFLHAFATNEPIKGARMTISADESSAEAEAQGDGVFTVKAPWLSSERSLDLVFTLTLSDGTQDLLTGRLQQVEAHGARTSLPNASASQWGLERFLIGPEMLAVAVGSAISGILLTLLFVGSARRRSTVAADPSNTAVVAAVGPGGHDGPATHAVTPLRRTAGALALAFGLAVSPFGVQSVEAADATKASPVDVPSVPSTMATDLAQRMPDGTLFVPKATQHLLSIRTILTARGKAPLATELAGTITAAPGHLGRVQPGRPGRIDAADGGMAFVGSKVEKGEILAYVESYIEAADQANIDSQIAETEARIEKNKIILSRYQGSPGSVPQVKVDEVRGEIDALSRRRAELIPSLARRVPITAPISGVVSISNATVGQIVDARDILFEIVNPSQFWVEAHGYGQEADFVAAPPAAFAVTASGERLVLQFRGRGLALRNQASVLTFKIDSPAEGLSVGSPVTVILQKTVDVDGFVVPTSAIVRGQTGLPIVWRKIDAERFEPQLVKLLPLDGRSVVVATGVGDDERIVTDGVALLNQVR